MERLIATVTVIETDKENFMAWPDGKLWNINQYKTDMIQVIPHPSSSIINPQPSTLILTQVLGGVEWIQEHTLFNKGTHFPTREGPLLGEGQ